MMWTLDQGVELVRKIQPDIHKLKYHVALAGGVLNKGCSDKDIDLVFVPLTNENVPVLGDLVNYLYQAFGTPKDNVTDPVPCVSLRYQASYLLEHQRIDVFVI